MKVGEDDGLAIFPPRARKVMSANAASGGAGALPVPSFNAQLEERSVVGFALSSDGTAGTDARVITDDDVARLRDASLL